MSKHHIWGLFLLGKKQMGTPFHHLVLWVSDIGYWKLNCIQIVLAKQLHLNFLHYFIIRLNLNFLSHGLQFHFEPIPLKMSLVNSNDSVKFILIHCAIQIWHSSKFYYFFLVHFILIKFIIIWVHKTKWHIQKSLKWQFFFFLLQGQFSWRIQKKKSVLLQVQRYWPIFS